ncbi:MAG: hypothetical protein KF819_36710 [Labilithrix sp.]|nr:hypothetical protein [Labilithrix sp.]
MAMYAIAVNVFLSTSLFERTVNATPDSVFIQYERAWSILPGRVHTKKLWIRGKDSQVEWALELDDCTFDVSFLDLATKKKFHVTRVDAEGIAFRLRRRIPSPAATAEYVAALPPIPGFAPIPVRPAEAPDLRERWDDAHWRLWTIHLENVDARAWREIWVDTLRIEGRNRLGGSFYLKPLREVIVGPVDVEAQETRVGVGGRSLVERVEGTARIAMRRFDPRVVDDAGLVRSIELATDLRGEVPDLAHLPRSMRPLEVSGPVHVGRLALRIDAGTLREGTDVALQLPAFGVVVRDHRVRAALEARARARRDDGGLALAFEIGARGLVAAAPGGPAILRAGEASVAGRTSTDLFDLLGDLRARAAVRDAETDLRAGGLRARGHPTIEASFEVNGERARGTLDVRDDRLHLSFRDVDAATALAAHASVRDWAWRKDDLAVDDARVDLRDLRANVRGRGAGVAISRIGVRAPHVALADPLARLDVAVSVAGAAVHDAAPLNALLAKEGGAQIVANDGALDAEIRASVVDRVARGTLRAHARAVGVGGQALRVLGEIDVAASVDRWSFDDRRVTFASRVIVADLEARFDARGAPAATAKRVELTARIDDLDTRSPSLRAGDYELRVSGARLDDARRLDALLPPETFLAIESGRAEGSAELAISSRRRVARGSVAIALRDAGLRFHETRLSGDFDVTTKLSGFDPDRETLDLRGSRIALRNVAASTEASLKTAAWHGEVDLLKADLRIGDPPAIDAFVQLHARDASPILALVLRDMPETFGDLLRAPELAGQARFTVDGGRFAVRDAHARGGDTTIRGSYAVAGERRHGACLVAKGPLAVGLAVDDRGTTLRFWRLETWLREQGAAVIGLFESNGVSPPRAPAPGARSR